MSTASAYDRIGSFTVPAPVMTLDAFRAWAESDDYPERGRVTYYRGQVFFDLSTEFIDSHLTPRASITHAIDQVVREDDLGDVYYSGAWFTNDEADLSNEPDAMFTSWDSMTSGRIGPPDGWEDNFLELRGTPDWVCEIVSDSSEKKDLHILREAYFKAGIPEYWLLDARGEEIDFKLLVAGEGGYEETPADADGWRRSPVFDREFHLSRSRDRVNRWRYKLQHR